MAKPLDVLDFMSHVFDNKQMMTFSHVCVTKDYNGSIILGLFEWSIFIYCCTILISLDVLSFVQQIIEVDFKAGQFPLTL